MSSEYLMLIDGIQKGPLPPEMLKSKGLKPETLVWCKGMADWTPAREVAELRSLFPWKPPKKVESTTSQADEQPARQEKEPPQKKPTGPTPPKNDADHDGLLDRIKEFRFSEMEAKHQKILIGVLVGGVFLPLMIWGIGSLFSGGSSKIRNEITTRKPDKDEKPRPIRPPKKKTKSAKQPGAIAKNQSGKKGAVVIGPGRLTEDYYQLVREIAFDRLYSYRRTRSRPKEITEAVIKKLDSLSREAADPVIAKLAGRAKEWWSAEDLRQFQNVRRRRTRRDAFTPLELKNRLQQTEVVGQGIKRERELRDIWAELLSHMRLSMNQSAPLAPGLVSLSLKNGRGSQVVAEAFMGLSVVNTSKRDLHHTTIEVELETPWGLKTTNYYYTDILKAGEKRNLHPGAIWDIEGLEQTGALKFSVWSDQGVVLKRSVNLDDVRKGVIQHAFRAMESELYSGQTGNTLFVAKGLSENSQLDPATRTHAKRLLATAQQASKSEQDLYALLVEGKEFIGHWKFGRYSGDLAMKITEIEKSTRNPTLKLPAHRTTSDRNIKSVTIQIYEPQSPPEHRLMFGQVRYLPEESAFFLIVAGKEVGGRVGLPGEHSRLPNSSRNYLLRDDKRVIEFRAVNNVLNGRMAAGDQFLMIPTDFPQKAQRLSDWKRTSHDFSMSRLPGIIDPIPQKVRARFLQKPQLQLDWAGGELRRFGGRSEDGKQQAPPVTGLVFSPVETTFVSSYTGSRSAAWNARTGEMRYRLPAGSPLAFSPDGRRIITADKVGIRIFATRGVVRKKFNKADQRFGYSATIAAYGPLGKQIAAVHADGKVDLFDDKGVKQFSMKHTNPVISMHFSPDGKSLFTSTQDQMVHRWSLEEEGKYLSGIKVGEFPVQHMRVSPDGNFLLTAAKAKTLKKQPPVYRQGLQRKSEARFEDQYELQIWDLRSNSSLYRARLGRSAVCFEISPDWSHALIGEKAGSIEVWDLTTGTETHHLVGHSTTPRGLSFSSDGRFAVSGSDDGWVILWGMPYVTPPPETSITRKNDLSPQERARQLAERKLADARRKLRLAEAALKSGKRERASQFLREAEALGGKDSLVQAEIRRLLLAMQIRG
ncbi:MAG: hypothetical protein Tsb009_33430 [Planctomycetaceae bacterium]